MIVMRIRRCEEGRAENMLTGNKTLSARSKCPGESDLLASIEDRQQVSGKTKRQQSNYEISNHDLCWERKTDQEV